MSVIYIGVVWYVSLMNRWYRGEKEMVILSLLLPIFVLPDFGNFCSQTIKLRLRYCFPSLYMDEFLYSLWFEAE